MLAPSNFFKSSGSAQGDLEALLVRMQQRFYPETTPVLVSYWLKTICSAGHQRGWWKDLDGLMQNALRHEVLDGPQRLALTDVRNWIEQTGVIRGKTPGVSIPQLEPYRTNFRAAGAASYVARLLNEWLSIEVASLLVNDAELAGLSDVGIPVLAVGRALERVLVRERLSPGTLEIFLQSSVFSPQFVYPAELEMLRDVVLFLLGRTVAPPPPVLPAVALTVSSQGPARLNIKDAVQGTILVRSPSGDEIQVPIASDTARTNEILVTMDGRWWAFEVLGGGAEPSAVYKPAGRLQIDYSQEHARLTVPSPETRLRWAGEVHFEEPVEIFGREWRITGWESEGDRTWLHLVFSRALVAEDQPEAETYFVRSRPASVDIAWAAVGDALAVSMSQKNREPIENLTRADFVPLGRALVGLSESMSSWRMPKRETLDTQLRAIRYLQTEISIEYGRVPWRILPESVRASFLKKRWDDSFIELLNQVFEGLPDALNEEIRKGAASAQPQSATPSNVA